MAKRKCGVLLPVFSLPTPYGIGTFGKEAYRFVDFLASSGQSYWQMLPLNPTGNDSSPYNSFSAFALNPYFIDLDTLAFEGLLVEDDLAPLKELPSDYVDYGRLHTTRFAVLRKAYTRFRARELRHSDESDHSSLFQRFTHDEASWLDDYADFMVLKDLNCGRSWLEWPEELKDHTSEAVRSFLREHMEAVSFYRFLQYKAYSQYAALKEYANLRGIKIIGDIPLYCSLNSADLWAHPNSFLLNPDGTPSIVGGIPSDSLSNLDPLSDSPIYHYEAMKKNGFAFWRKRIRAMRSLYDILMIHHFRGIAGFCAIPYGAQDATEGKWVTGPGEKLVDAIVEEQGEMKIIAEDLGQLDERSLGLKEYSGWPGIRIVQEGYDSDDSSNPHNPHHIEQNSVAYLGTQDSPTTMGYIDSNKDRWDYIARDLDIKGEVNRDSIFDAVAESLTRSAAARVIYTMQDMLRLGDEARLNTPGIAESNWRWRLPTDYAASSASERLRYLGDLGGRKRRL